MPRSHPTTIRHLFRAAVVIAIGALALGVAACRSSDNDDADATPSGAKVDGQQLVLPGDSPRLASLSSSTVVAQPPAPLALTGHLVWNEDATVRVFSPFAGRVTRVLADLGQSVAAGAPLALLASPDFGQAQADARRASTDLAVAQRTLERQRDLLAHGIVAQKDVEAAAADVDRARVEQQRAVARLALYGGDTSTVTQVLPLTSAIAGLVVERNIVPGQEVRPDQMLANAPQLFAPLFVVTDLTHLWVQLDVPEQDLPFVRVGAPITLHSQAWPDRVFHGRITLTAGALDPTTRTLKVRGLVDNTDGLLKAEMMVAVEAPRMQGTELTVPASAVLLEGERNIVFVEQARGHYLRREVQVGAEHGGNVPVLSGLRLGERVVSGSALLLEQLFQTSAHS